EDEDGDGYVAVSSAVLELTAGRCRVMAPEAALARDPDDAARSLSRLREIRTDAVARRRGVIADLEREVLRRLAHAMREDR
ncbi:MAG: hypothetical protein KC619_25410, partial [Myxococcales bacterium]|nr:hypothetical protein [Myxococcales bacterium]